MARWIFVAMEKDGSEAFKIAFGVLGRLAMQELMSNPDVNASVAGFTKYIDKSKLDSGFSKSTDTPSRPDESGK